MQHWKETTEEEYYHMLGALPPIYAESRTGKRGFLVGEPSDHTANGFPMYPGYAEHGGKYYATTGIATVRLFREWLAEFPAANA